MLWKQSYLYVKSGCDLRKNVLVLQVAHTHFFPFKSTALAWTRGNQTQIVNQIIN